MGETRSFVVLVTFLVLFGLTVGYIPVSIFAGTPMGAQAPEGGFDPTLIAGYAETESFRSNATYFDTVYALGTMYDYDLSGSTFICLSYTGYVQFRLGVKTLLFGVVWLGGVEWLEFSSLDTGSQRGDTLTLDNIQDDYEAEGQPVRYRLSGDGGYGDLLITWNTTTYSTAALAAAASSLYFVHGVGVGEGSMNAVSLLLSILTFRAPNVHPAINAMIAIPIYAAAAFMFLLILEKVKPL